MSARTIWRRRLTFAAPTETLTFPEGARVLAAQVRQGTPDAIDVWAELDPDQPDGDVVVQLAGTGYAEVPLPPARYVATLQLSGGALVLHAYVSGDAGSDMEQVAAELNRMRESAS